MNIHELKQWASNVRPDLPTAKVIDVLVEDFRGEGTVYSPAAVAMRAHAESSNVLAILLLLADSPTNLLKGQWLFFDDEGEEFPLTSDEVAEALRTGEFFHPLSGAPIFSYRESIGLVYEAEANLARMITPRTSAAPPTQRV